MHRVPILAWLTAMLTALTACGGGGGGGGGGGASAPVTPPVAATPAPTTPAPMTSAYPAGLSEQSIMVNGVQRQFLVHMPATLTGRPNALILVLHGGTGSGAQAANPNSALGVFRSVADREGLVAVYPTGLDNNWNDCRGDAPALRDTGDDVAFFDALLTRLQGELGVDARRIFVSGTSNGAIMSMRYAFERPERIAGIAVSSGSLPAQPKAGACTTGPSRPVPVLMTHGTLDPLVPYAGGCVALPLTGGVCTQGTVIGAEATRDRWLRINGLAGVTPQVATVEIATDDGGPAVQSRYAGASPVEWWRLEGAGHSSPSRTVFAARDASGTQNHDVEFAEIAWTFFKARLP